MSGKEGLNAWAVVLDLISEYEIRIPFASFYLNLEMASNTFEFPTRQTWVCILVLPLSPQAPELVT